MLFYDKKKVASILLKNSHNVSFSVNSYVKGHCDVF